jgi:membrane-associated protease RseP (regulator of RpoE activity)
MKRTITALCAGLLLLSSMGALFAQGQSEPVEAAPGVEQSDDQDDDTPSGQESTEPIGMIRESAGVVITALVADGAAERAGLIRGDIILSVNDRETDTLAELQGSLEGLSHGETVSLKILRGGEPRTVELTLEDRIGWPLIGIYGRGTADAAGMYGRGGAWPLEDDLLEMLRQGPLGRARTDDPYPMFDEQQLPDEVLAAVRAGNAAHVTEVSADSPAAEAGISAPAIIYMIDDSPVLQGDLGGSIRSYQAGDTITIKLYQDEAVHSISVTLGELDGNPFLGLRYYPMQPGIQNQMRGLPFDSRPGPMMNRDLDRLDG